MKALDPNRVEYWNAVWKQRAGRRIVDTDITRLAWLEPWPIPKRAFRVDVHVYSDGEPVHVERLEIAHLAGHKHAMASPLGVVFE